MDVEPMEPEPESETEPKPGPQPSDSLSMFGAVVKGLREHAGLSREEFGRLVGFSKHTVASIEQGRRVPDWDFVMAADAALGYTDVLHEAFKKVCEPPCGLAAWFNRWAWYERRAVSLYTYECRLIPGLLQTDAYATCVFTDQMPPLNDDQVATRLSARKKRQSLLYERPNTAYHFLLEENLFLRRTGGKQVTRELVEHVLALTEVRNIEVQIMPLVQERHAGLGGPLQLLETSGKTWLAYCEGQEGGQFIHDPNIVSVLHQRYARMRSQALTPPDSIALLERLKGAL
ncbi:helix-turn-helix domain-containing protein [Streptomyces odontomachi]|uniref:helix-turn-helix domain-containing protein n=1 Tax=Streptomyces odontomachi TaxID=2944940 RepID=UPI00210A349E|nr:helix-turn-helix transcriptional regulator [Streptomyces sp. ODS25]